VNLLLLLPIQLPYTVNYCLASALPILWICFCHSHYCLLLLNQRVGLTSGTCGLFETDNLWIVEMGLFTCQMPFQLLNQAHTDTHTQQSFFRVNLD